MIFVVVTVCLGACILAVLCLSSRPGSIEDRVLFVRYNEVCVDSLGCCRCTASRDIMNNNRMRRNNPPTYRVRVHKILGQRGDGVDEN